MKDQIGARKADNGRSIRRTIVVAVLALWAVGTCVPQIFQFWHVFGTWPFSLDPYDTIIQGVAPDSPAARAGLKSGDHVDFRRASFEDRAECTIAIVASPQLRCGIPVVQSGRVKLVTVNAQPLPFTTRAAIVAVLGVVGTVFFVLTAACLVLLRPSAVTWSFFALSLYYNPGDVNYFVALLTPLQATIEIFASLSFWGFALWGTLYFGLMFPSGAGSTMRLALARWSWIVPALAVATLFPANAIFAVAGAVIAPELQALAVLLGPATKLLSIVAMAISFAVARGLDRQRVQWVLLAFAASMGVQEIYSLLSIFSVVSVELGDVLYLTFLLLPLAVSYTVLVHRVFDIKFIVSRAVVYGVVTAILVAIFATIDWFFTRVLAQTKLALLAELATAIGLGFWLNGLHTAVDKFIDATLFRARYKAEQRLTRAATAVRHLTSTKAVEDVLVSDPADALNLASAALFRLEDDNCFHRHAAVNWPTDAKDKLEPDDRLVAELRGSESAIRIVDVRWTEPNLPQGAAHPVLAEPLCIRHELQAIALYGAHTSGEDIDPDERRAIETLAEKASAAFDHIKNLELQREVETLKRQLMALQANPVSS